MRLAGHAAVVTGAAGNGIGRAIAEAFVSEGAAVAAIDIRPPASDQDPYPTINADIGVSADFERALAAAEAAIGAIDILVNAAGITHRKPFADLTIDDWDAVHNVNLRACFVGIQWLTRSLRARRAGGSVINIGSIGASSAIREQAHYSAAKAGLVMLTRAAAVELAPYGIRVNALSPGTVETDFNRDLLTDVAFRELRTTPIPLGRIGVPEDVAPAAVFLASPESGFVTGANLVVDGGQTA